MLEYIKLLRSNYKTAVLSNANIGSLERKIGKEWLQACFDVVIVSADVGMVKPDSRIYTLTTERLGVEPNECVFIDDREIFLVVAREMGMKTILYESMERTKAALTKLQVSI